MPLADKSCTLSIINRVVEYLKKHAEFEANNSDDEVSPFHLFRRALCPRLPLRGRAPGAKRWRMCARWPSALHVHKGQSGPWNLGEPSAILNRRSRARCASDRR